MRPLFEPESVPHDPAFEDPVVRGPAIAAERLRPAELRRRFAAERPWEPELRSDPRFLRPDQPVRPAAVLMPLVVHDDQVSVLLTQRTAHLNDHAGQISFPGGRVEAGDLDAVATALREAREEIGLGAALVDVVAMLPEYTTATGYRVTPVIGMIEGPYELSLDRFEVSEAFAVPLAFLMDPAHHERRLVKLGEIARTFYAMPYQAQRRYFIWGATASMLRNLYHYLRA
jgi:8-oxo-dGTP pyrophosphatase MutT (NUDIX family)